MSEKNKIDENLLISGFKDKQQFAREWREFDAIDTEAGWRELQKRVPMLRKLNFDGTWAESPSGSSSESTEISPGAKAPE